ncbi:MAG: peptide ABC transporter substrate-binding protein, partial [Mesorhizobium sp.]
AYAGEAAVATGTIAPGLVGHRDKALVPPEGDLTKAREFLEKAGVSDLTLTISVESADAALAQAVQAQLSQIGIALTVDVQESGSFWTLGMESEGERWKELQLFFTYFNSVPDPHYATVYFVSDQVGIWNWQRFRSERYDELSAKAATVSDPGERATMYYEMQDLMEESGAFRFITNGSTPLMYRTTQMQAATRPDGRPLYNDFGPA